MVTNGALLRMKYSAGTVAGLCDRMFQAALLVRVGLLGFPDSQNGGGGSAIEEGLSPFAAAWTDLESIVRSKPIGGRRVPCDLTPVWSPMNRKVETDSDVENRLTAFRGGGRGAGRAR